MSMCTCSRCLRFSADVDNTETNRRDWREVLYTADGLGQYISACIMFEETLYQSAAGGKPFVDVLKEQGIIPGIKVDTGLQASSGQILCYQTHPCKNCNSTHEQCLRIML